MSEKFLVISRTHSLLPIAHRLKLEGHDVEVLVSVAAFEKAWSGKLGKVLRNSKGQINQTHLEPAIAAAERGEVTVLIDDWGIETLFGNAKRKFGVCRLEGESEPESPLRVGGWFNGETFDCFHGLIVDRGAWTGGQGPNIDSALTMVRNDSAQLATFMGELIKTYEDLLKSNSFKGLAQFGIKLDTVSGAPEIDGVLFGFPFLHTHAFLSGLEDFGDILLGKSNPVLPKKFTTVLTISRPPYPNRKARFRRPVAIGNLTDQQIGRVFWHDMQVTDPTKHLLSTAGLDGLVGISRGEADTSELSRGLALEVAQRISLPEKQYRLDVGGRVQGVLAELEGFYGVTL